MAEPLTYAGAGVDIDAGDEAVSLIKADVASTNRPEVIGAIGGFGGMFALPPGRYAEPVLVAATDGVGTKLELARSVGRLDTVGIDLVAMCVDDLVCQGAEPLFFLDYLATERLDPAQARDLVAGVAEGCRQAGCALLGGEMAEHPGTMIAGSFDLAGFAVGVVERARILDNSLVRPGDELVGLASPGLRSNGYSLVRAIVAARGLDLAAPAWPGAGRSLGEELLVPSVIYCRGILSLRDQVEIHGVAHVTGGGIVGNVPRMLGSGVDAVLERGSWPVPPIFDHVAEWGAVAEDEMLRVFNLGLGMVVATPTGAAAVAALAAAGLGASVVGRVEPGSGEVRFV